MDALQLVSVVKRLPEGICPKCFNKLNYISGIANIGLLEKNGMANTCNTISEKHIVYCNTCGYQSKAIQIGLKLIPIDRINETDINWDKKYLEENTLISCEEGKNPFNKR